MIFTLALHTVLYSIDNGLDLESANDLLLILDDDFDLFPTPNRFQRFFSFRHGVCNRNEGFQIHDSPIQHINSRRET
jgi:hypothetical protein